MKKKILVTVGVILGVVLVVMTVFLFSIYNMVQQGYGITVGRYLKSTGGHMLIAGNSATTMSAQNGDSMFEGLTTGDKIVVVHGLIMETYPAQTDVLYCFKQEDGGWSDISVELLTDLANMGWVNKDEIIQYKAESCDFEDEWIRTNPMGENHRWPETTIISSVEELNDYYEIYKDKFDLERKDKVYSDTTIGFLDACDKYDETYFETKSLVLFMVDARSGSIRHLVKSVGIAEEDGEEKLVITITSQVPEVMTDDIAYWICFVELEKENVVEDVEDIIIVYPIN